jgi:hypothetical protein
MTVAVCTRCGAEKFGAFNPCKECGYAPESVIEKAQSVLLSDHHYTHLELRIIGARIGTGEPVNYAPDALRLYARTLERMETNPEALECKLCGGYLDSFEEAICQKCRDTKRT